MQQDFPQSRAGVNSAKQFIRGQELEELRLKLNSICFPGCEDVLIGDVLYYPIYFTNVSHASRLKKILRIIRTKLSFLKIIFTRGYIYYEAKEPKTLFFFSSERKYRNDQELALEKLLSIFPNNTFAIYRKNVFGLAFYHLRYIRLFLQWSSLFQEIIDDVLLRNRLLLSLILIFCNYKDAERALNFSKIDNLITWCDYHAAGSFFTQRFNALRKKTITLMHGSIGIIGDPWSVKGSKSQYLIADSRYTKDILENNGYLGSVRICGYVYSIDAQNKQVNNKQRIGILLSGEQSGSTDYHNSNIELCRNIANIKKYEKYCKLHPSSRKSNYPQDIWLPFTEVYESEISSAEFLSKIDMAIICPSTVIYEALYRSIPFLVHADKEDLYKLYEMPEEITIHNYEELLTKIEKAMSGEYNSIYEKLADYYTPQGNIKENYLKRFHELGIY